MKDKSYSTSNESDLENLFNISLDEIKDIVQDVLDEDTYLGCEVSIRDSEYSHQSSEFILGFEHYEHDIYTDAGSWTFPRGIVIKHLEEIKTSLKIYGLGVCYISNEEYPDDDKCFAVNIFVKKLEDMDLAKKIKYGYHPYFEAPRVNESSNFTNKSDELKLDKWFGLTSDDVKTWFQDFLDEYLELDFEVSIINDKHFVVNIYNQDALNNQYNRGDWSKYTITKERYPVSDELIKFIQDRLNYYDLKLNRGSNNYVEYSANGTYMGFSIAKVPNRSYL